MTPAPPPTPVTPPHDLSGADGVQNKTPADWYSYVAQVERTVPRELRATRAWVQVKLVREGTKLKKIPYPTYDKVNEYLTFEQARRYRAGFSGCLGFSNYGGAAVTILDCDHCFEGAGIKRHLSAGVLSHVNHFPGYWEISPSHGGIRSFLLGELPARRDGKQIFSIGGLEIYRRKWATVTGNVLYGEINQIAALGPELVDLWLKPDTRTAGAIAGKGIPGTGLKDKHGQVWLGNEEGDWTPRAQLAFLEAYAKGIPGFKFLRSSTARGQRSKLPHAYFVPCPGGSSTGWCDGTRHSTLDTELSRDTVLWLNQGYLSFCCLHDHCRKVYGFRDFCEHYDPLRLCFDLEEWEDAEIAKRNPAGEIYVKFCQEHGGVF